MLKNRRFFLWTTIYKILFEVVYIVFTSPQYSYMNMIYKPNINYFFLSYFLFFVLLWLIPKDQKKPSTQLTQLLFITTMVPFLSFFWMSNNSIIYTMFVFLCYIILFFLLRLIKPLKIPLLRKETNLTPKITSVIFISSIIILFLHSAKFGGVDVRAFNFNTIYEIRSETSYSGIWAYLSSWIGVLLIPTCIVIYMIENKKILFVTSCIMQIFLYLSTGNKSILFSVILLFVATYILQKNTWDRGMAKFYSLLIIISAIAYKIFDNLWLIGLFIVRMLALPAEISYKYYNFFSNNDKLFFSEGVIGKILGINSPYDIPAGNIIAGTMTNFENTGFLSDAYSNGGLIAMIFMMILFSIVLLSIDSISRNSKCRFKYTALMVYPINTLNNSSLITLLLTGGVGFLLIFIYILASEEKNKKTQITKVIISNKI